MKDANKELEQDEGQDKIHITKDKIIKILRKMSNWKDTGPDSWLKNLTPLLDKLLVYLQDYLDFGEVTDELTKGRTVLIPKDKDRRNIASNY